VVKSPSYFLISDKIDVLVIERGDGGRKKATYTSRGSLGVKSRGFAEFSGDIALTLRERLVTFPQDVEIFSKSLMDGDPALWRLSQRRFS
jgi:hypothetical protein